ncbi:cyclic nucleotide-binding domain protein (macronuclear) [Tetrahymena thermophila SB210]|uniref:Cyclic nucleotide-binding domain protein n=1 Tax=Tetrahymena thermophila (strain SB210) TaxID=312017 RepID=I7MFU4_TETTS|nr:cyclic nucleotide-binding domain protein [Tetrahymena thermophila SB210]EAS00604.2 cyclic nucleotide-binding domain protein [Tetrahymena thermophila SB210]|eukprot:XP_001020849.2 cyclic nucleotide-binding domain protein [Tetrahymena thermophila SB210]
MASLFSPRPTSSQSTFSFKSNEFMSPKLKKSTPTLVQMSSCKQRVLYTSPQHTDCTRPSSALQVNELSKKLGIFEYQDEVLTNSTLNQTRPSSRQSSIILNQMSCIIKPKKAMSAVSSQKSKKSPLLIYKENITQLENNFNNLELDQDYSKQYSIIQLQKQQKINEKKKESCPFEAFSAFRKEQNAGIKRVNSNVSNQLSISASKFFSKPICIGSPTANYKSQRKELSKSTSINCTEAVKNNNQPNKDPINQINYVLDVQGQKRPEDVPILADSKKMKKNQYIINLSKSYQQNQVDNTSTEQGNQDSQQLAKERIIDQRLSISPSFIMNFDLNKIQTQKFMKNNQILNTTNAQTEQTPRSSNISTQKNTCNTDRNKFSSQQKQKTTVNYQKIAKEQSIQSALAKFQLWPPASNQKTQEINSTPQKDQKIKFKGEFNFIKQKYEEPNQIKQQNMETENKVDEERILEHKTEVQQILEQIPDYKFDSNNKAVSNHLNLKARKIFLYDKNPSVPLMQVHFSKKEVDPIYRRNVQNNKLKYCEQAEFVGNLELKQPQKTKTQKKTIKKKKIENEVDRFQEYQDIIRKDQQEKAEIRERNRQLALLNFSDFSDAQTEKILDDEAKPEDLFSGASKWIDKSPVSEYIEQKFPLVKNYVDKIWSYYKQHDEIQDFGDNNGSKNNPKSIKVIDDQAEEIQKIYNQINRMNSVFSQRLEEIQKYENKNLIDEFLKTNDERLTVQELNLIIDQFTSPQNQIDIMFVDQILTKLKFFSNFNPQTRKQLMKLGKLIKKEKGEIVFNQGDFGDQMYIILFGSCNVQVKYVNDYGVEIERVVATLYDGQQFGELAMMKTTTKKQKQTDAEVNLKEKQLKDIRKKLIRYDGITKLERNYLRKGIKKTRSWLEFEYDRNQKKNEVETEENTNQQFNELDEDNQMKKQNKEILERTKRAATIQMIEESYLMSISKSDFQLVLMNLMQAELDNKIKLLSTIHLFDMFQPFALIPLANLLKTRKYGVNDLIVEQGKPLKFFYIVSQGRLKVLRIEKTSRKLKQQIKPKNMIFSIMKYKENEEEKKEKDKLKNHIQEIEEQPILKDYDSSSFDSDDDIENVERLLRDSKLANTEKVFDYQKFGKPDKEIVFYKKFVEYGSFSQGDYFGGRVLTGKNKDDNPQGLAQKAVIADTNEVELYVLEKNQLQYLPQFIKDWLIQCLECTQEFDDLDKKTESQKNRNWENFKEQMYEITSQHLKQQIEVQKAKIW